MTLTKEEQLAGGAFPVLKQQRSLYGLKQTGRLWNNMLHAQLLAIGYACCKTDLCLYYKHEDSNIAVVRIFVDDLLATATSSSMTDDLFTSLKTLDVKDLVVVRKFLGMRVEFKNDGFSLDQETLTRDYLEANSMTKANPVSTSTVLHQDFEDGELLDPVKVKVHTLAGGLLWLD